MAGLAAVNRNVALEGSASACPFGSRFIIAVEDVDKWADFEIREEGMAKMAVTVDPVAVATPDLGPLDIAPGDQVSDYPLGGSLGDPDALGDVTRARVRVAGDAQQRVAV